MRVGVGVVTSVIAGEPVALGPAVLAVVRAGPAGNLRVARVQVQVKNIAGLQRVLVGHIDDVPDIGGGRRVGETEVVVDDLVQR